MTGVSRKTNREFTGCDKKDDEGVCKESGITDQEKPENSTQGVNTARPSINTEPDMFSLGDNATLEPTPANFFGDETKVDMSNITTTYPILSTLNTRIHKDHSLDHVIGKTHEDLHTCLFACFLSQIEPKKVWSLVNLPYGKRAIRTKWVYKNKKDKRGIVVRNKARLVAQGYTQEERIDYDAVFALVARIKAIRLKRKFISVNLQGLKIQMSLTEFIRLKMHYMVYIKLLKPDDIIFRSTKKELCTEFKKLMHKKFQMSSMGELTFFLGLQVMQKEDGIFISQDKYVDEILKKFGFSTVRISSTPIETSKPLLKDAQGLDRISTTGDTPSHTKKVFANMRRQGKDFSRTMTPLFATMFIQSQAVEGEGSGQPTELQHTPTTASPSHVEPIPIVASSSQPKKTQKHRKTKRKATEISQSSGPTTLVADETVHEERRDNVERAATTAISLDAEQGSGNINRTQSTTMPNDPFPQEIGSCGSPRRQDTILGDRPAQTRFERLSKQSNDPPLLRVNILGSREDSMKLHELIDLCIKLSERVLALENIKTAQDLEITNLKKRVKKLEKKKKSRTPQLKRRLFKVRIESSAKKSLETQWRYGHDVSTADVTTASVPVDVDVSTASPTRLVDDSTTDDITLAETLMKIKSNKRKGIMQEPEKPVKVKGKDQIEYDVDVAQRLQAELDEEARLKREREEKASNVALIKE
ncbi:putative ribonuclease H-like domain-containing protein [Tanacetum coccineum]